MVISFIGGGYRITRSKTNDLPQITDKLYHIMLYQLHLSWLGLELTTLRYDQDHNGPGNGMERAIYIKRFEHKTENDQTCCRNKMKNKYYKTVWTAP
jgi:hypothetical protein